MCHLRKKLLSTLNKIRYRIQIARQHLCLKKLASAVFFSLFHHLQFLMCVIPVSLCRSSHRLPHLCYLPCLVVVGKIDNVGVPPLGLVLVRKCFIKL